MDQIKALLKAVVLLIMVCCLVLSVVPVLADTGVAPQPLNPKTDLVLNLLPGSYYDRIRAGEETQLFLEVRNQGNTIITGIRFNAALPKDWTVRFIPAELAVLTPGSSNTVEAFILLQKNVSGSYNVTFLAQADQTRAVTSAYFNVNSGSILWLWLGIGIGVVVITGFVMVFLRLGKH